MDDLIDFSNDFAHLARLASIGNNEDVRLFLGRLIRKYRNKNPDFSNLVEKAIKASTSQSNRSSILRELPLDFTDGTNLLPKDADSKLSLIRVINDVDGINAPLLSDKLLLDIKAIIDEQKSRDRLKKHGISPTSSAILVGPPGVGKTLSARWIASQLGKPLWILDLTAVMSSLLGKTGNNLRAVFDYAKENNAILLLDEIDAIAKRRSDESDIGELKRLVTVILQEVEQWPDSGLLLAATNYPELVDPALWRRFDQVLTFENPTSVAIKSAIERFFYQDLSKFKQWTDLLAVILQGKSLSDVEKVVSKIRRSSIMLDLPPQSIIAPLVAKNIENLSKSERLVIASQLASTDTFSHHEISRLTTVARDTIRKHAGPSARLGRGHK